MLTGIFKRDFLIKMHLQFSIMGSVLSSATKIKINIFEKVLCHLKKLRELAELLGVTEKATSKRLEAMGMIQKQENWVPYELKPIDV